MTEEPPFERSAYLGRFDELEAEVVVEILAGHDIAAFLKVDPDKPEATPYGPALSDRGIVLVDASHLDEARRIIDEELPEHLRSIERAMQEVERDWDTPPEAQK